VGVPHVIKVLAIVWSISSVKVLGLGIVFITCVGDPNVAGLRCVGQLGGDLVLLGRTSTNGFFFFGK
jgi:hypothetical protein